MGILLIGAAALAVLFFAVKPSAPPTPTLNPGHHYAFVLRAELGSLPAVAQPMLAALLLSQYALQVDASTNAPSGGGLNNLNLVPDANDLTLWRGTAGYLMNEPMAARDTSQIRFVQLAQIA